VSPREVNVAEPSVLPSEPVLSMLPASTINACAPTTLPALVTAPPTRSVAVSAALTEPPEPTDSEPASTFRAWPA